LYFDQFSLLRDCSFEMTSSNDVSIREQSSTAKAIKKKKKDGEKPNKKKLTAQQNLRPLDTFEALSGSSLLDSLAHPQDALKKITTNLLTTV